MELNQTPKTEYLIKDLYEAAYFISEGKKLLRLEPDKNSTKFSWFVFDNSDGTCPNLSNKFWQSETPIKTYSENIERLKDRLFSQRR